MGIVDNFKATVKKVNDGLCPEDLKTLARRRNKRLEDIRSGKTDTGLRYWISSTVSAVDKGKQWLALNIDEVADIAVAESVFSNMGDLCNSMHSLRRKNADHVTPWARAASAFNLLSREFQRVREDLDDINTEEDGADPEPPERWLANGKEFPCQIINLDKVLIDLISESCENRKLLYEDPLDVSARKKKIRRRSDIVVESKGGWAQNASDWDTGNIEEPPEDKKRGVWSGTISGYTIAWIGDKTKSGWGKQTLAVRRDTIPNHRLNNDWDIISDIFDEVRRRFWLNRSRNQVLEISRQITEDHNEYRGSTAFTGRTDFVLVDQPPLPSWPSKLSKKLEEKCAAYIEKNIHRTILLNGPPGTGKTTAIRDYVEKSKRTSLVLPVQYLASSRHLFALLKIVRPDIIVIDDFDRIGNPETQLDFLISLKEVSKIVLLSSNSSNLPDALLRPGRVDMFIEHLKADKSVRRSILGELANDSRITNLRSIEDMPIAFLVELVNRCNVEGVEETVEYYDELIDRCIKQNSNWFKQEGREIDYGDDDDDDGDYSDDYDDDDEDEEYESSEA